MKRIFSILLILLIYAAPVSEAAKEDYLLFDDFEEGLSGWTSGNLTEPDASGGSYLKITNSSASTAYSDKSFNLTYSEKVTLECDINVQQSGTGLAHFMPMKGNSTVARIYFSTGLRADNATTSKSHTTSFANQKWNKVKAVLDFTAHTYSVYVNSVLVATATGLELADKTVGGIDKIRFGVNASSPNETEVWYDNLKIYEGTVSPDEVTYDFTAADEFIIKNKIFTENFDDYPDGIMPPASVWNATMTDIGDGLVVSDNWAGNVLKVTNSSNTKDMFFEKTFSPLTGKVEIICDLLTDLSSNASNGVIWINNNIIRVYQSTKLTVRNPQNQTVELKTGIPLGELHRVKIILDTVINKYDIYFDDMDNPAGTNLDFISPADSVSKILVGVPRVTGTNTFTESFDNIILYSYTPVKVLLADGANVINNSVLPLDINRLTLVFDREMLVDTVNADNLSVIDSDGNSVPLSVTANNDSQFEIVLTERPEPQKEYRLKLSKSIRDKNASPLLADSYISFTSGGAVTTVKSQIYDGETLRNDIKSVTGASAVIKTEIKNYTGEAISPYLTGALYNDGVLCDIAFESTEISGDCGTLEITLNNLPADKTSLSFDIFLTRDLNDFAPFLNYSLTDVFASADYSAERNKITVTGNAGNEAGNNILLIVSEKSSIDMESISYIKQLKTESGGDFSIEFSLPQESEAGFYKVFVKGYNDSGEAYNTSFAYFSSQNLSDANNEKSSISSIADLKAFMENKAYMTALGMDNEFYLNANDKNFIAGLLFSYFTKDNFYKAAAVDSIINSPENSYNALISNAGILNLSCTAELSAISSIQKTAVNTALKNISVITLDNAGVRFADVAVTALINAEDKWVDRKKLMLETFLAVVNCNVLDKYSNLKNKDTPFILLKDTIFADLNDVRTVFLSCVDTAYKQENQSGAESTISGGNGGGGGVVSFSKATPMIPADSIDEKQLPFTDLENVGWALNAIKYLYNKNIINGVSESLFEPDRYITREEFVKLIVLSQSLTGRADISFSDLPSSHWSREYIETAFSSGIINGYDDGRFGLGDNITRQDIAVVVYKAINQSGLMIVNENISFDDNEKIAQYAEEAVNTLAKCGVLNGRGENSFEPAGVATRAEAAAVLYRIMSLRGGETVE